jgi:hypothetical protein
VAVARRAVDGDPGSLQPGAGLVDVVDLVGEMPEVAPAGVFLVRVPVVGQLDLVAGAAAGLGKEHQRRLGSVEVLAPGLDEAEEVAVELLRFLDIRDPDHCMEKLHLHLALPCMIDTKCRSNDSPRPPIPVGGMICR